MRSFVVGGAGFIGSHLIDRLVLRGPVTAYDNLSVGKRAFLADHLASGAVTLVEGDDLDLDHLAASMAGHDVVFHLAANPEARHGLANTRYDLEQGTIATPNVLEAMRRTACAPWCSPRPAPCTVRPRRPVRRATSARSRSTAGEQAREVRR